MVISFRYHGRRCCKLLVSCGWSRQEQVFLEGMVESWLSEYTGEAIDLE